jgi:hypothetical protein
MIDDALLSHCRNIVHTIAPELRNVQIVSNSVFDELTMRRDCQGYAIEAEHVTFDLSERIPDYTPGAPIIVLCPSTIREGSGDDAFRDSVLGVLLHECAHMLPRPVAANRITSPDLQFLDCAAVRARLDEKRSEAIAIPELGPDADDAVHGWRFLRRCCHLWARARQAGWDVPSTGMLGDAYWYCSQEAHWITALFPELVSLRSATFAEIESTETPPEFMRMWRGALSTYHRFSEHRP